MSEWGDEASVASGDAPSEMNEVPESDMEDEWASGQGSQAGDEASEMGDDSDGESEAGGCEAGNEWLRASASMTVDDEPDDDLEMMALAAMEHK